MSDIQIPAISICDLLAEVRELRTQVEEQGAAIYAGFEAHLHRDSYRDSARNLAHYLALRGSNLRTLQFELMHLGFASLGRIEANVLGALTAIEKLLDSLCNQAPYTPAPPEAAFAGLNRLRREASLVLGPQPADGSPRIMVTLDQPAAEDPAFAADLLARGMTCARINCAHDNAEMWTAMIRNVRNAAAEQGKTCAIYMDLAGPKIRTKAISFDKKQKFYEGDTLLLTRADPIATDAYPHQVSCAVPEVLDQVAVGQSVWFDDGKIGTRIVEIIPEGLVLRIEKTSPAGTRVRIRKGINFPETKLAVSPLTSKDLKDLDFIVATADMVGYSFVQHPDDITHLQDEIAARQHTRPDSLERLAIIAKVETKLAVSNLPDLIVRGAGKQPFGVMVARGDLAVEIGFERLAEMQEEIMWICEAAHVPVIWATQVLESVTKSGVTSRAEVTDAASGIKAECVMLNKGDYIAEAVSTLKDILHRMTGHQYKKFNVLRALHSWERYVQETEG